MCPCPRGGCEAFAEEVPKLKFTRNQVLALLADAQGMYWRGQEEAESFIDNFEMPKDD